MTNPAQFKRTLKKFLDEKMQTTGKDMHRLRREVAFEFFLERVSRSSSELVIKGAFLLEMRSDDIRGRSTKDIDFSLKRRLGKDLSKTLALKQVRTAIEKVCATPADDPFSYHILEAKSELGVGREWVAGQKFFIEAKLMGRNFERFEVDVASGDFVAETDQVMGGKLMGELGYSFSSIEGISREQHFAEKLHAYTMPREGTNTRAKDLVDMVILIRRGDLDANILAGVTAEAFAHRGSHGLKGLDFARPPESWAKRWPSLSGDAGVDLDLDQAYRFVLNFLDSCLLLS